LIIKLRNAPRTDLGIRRDHAARLSVHRAYRDAQLRVRADDGRAHGIVIVINFAILMSQSNDAIFPTWVPLNRDG